MNLPDTGTVRGDGGFTIIITYPPGLRRAIQRRGNCEVKVDQLDMNMMKVLGEYIEFSDNNNSPVPVARRIDAAGLCDLREYLNDSFTMADFARRFTFQISMVRARDWENREKE